MPTYRVQVITPCSENWNAMHASKKGKFCLSCQKNVVDFTGMNEKEIVDYLLKNKNTCGRFFDDQLDKEIRFIPNRPVKNYWPSIAALLVAGLFSVSPSFSQTIIEKLPNRTVANTEPKDPNILHDLEIFNADSLLKNKHESAKQGIKNITGIVMDKQDSTPVAYANITIEIDSIKIATVQTDSLGAFSFPNIKFDDEKNVVINVSAYRYAVYSAIIKEEETSRPLLIALGERTVTMGITNITIERKIEYSPNPGHYFFNAPGFN